MENAVALKFTAVESNFNHFEEYYDLGLVKLDKTVGVVGYFIFETLLPSAKKKDMRPPLETHRTER